MQALQKVIDTHGDKTHRWETNEGKDSRTALFPTCQEEYANYTLFWLTVCAKRSDAVHFGKSKYAFNFSFCGVLLRISAVIVRRF